MALAFPALFFPYNSFAVEDNPEEGIGNGTYHGMDSGITDSPDNPATGGGSGTMAPASDGGSGDGDSNFYSEAVGGDQRETIGIDTEALEANTVDNGIVTYGNSTTPDSYVSIVSSQIALFEGWFGSLKSTSSNPTGVTVGYYFHKTGSIGYILNSIYGDTSTIRTYTNWIYTGINNINETETEILGALAYINGSTAYTAGRMLYEIWQDTDSIDTKLTKTNSYLTSISNYNSNIAEDTWNTYKNTNTINTNLGSITSKLDTLTEAVRNIRVDVGDVNIDDTDILEAIDAVRQIVVSVNSNFSSTKLYIQSIYSINLEARNILKDIKELLQGFIEGGGTDSAWVEDDLYTLWYYFDYITMKLASIDEYQGYILDAIPGESGGSSSNIFDAVKAIADAIAAWGEGGINIDFDGLTLNLDANFDRLIDKLGDIELSGGVMPDDVLDVIRRLDPQQNVGDTTFAYKLSRYLGYLSAISENTTDIYYMRYEVKGLLQQILDKDYSFDGGIELDTSGIEAKLDAILALLTAQAVVDAADLLLGDLEGLGKSLGDLFASLSAAAQNVFPFCIPAVIKQVCGLMVYEASFPTFDIEIFGASFTLDFGEYSDLATGFGVMTSWICRIGLVLGLLVNTRRFVYGMGGSDA